MQVPYMVSAGNHESGFSFAHYTEFFRSQPSTTGTVGTAASKTSPNNCRLQPSPSPRTLTLL